jgi:hypothetical protein
MPSTVVLRPCSAVALTTAQKVVTAEDGGSSGTGLIASVLTTASLGRENAQDGPDTLHEAVPKGDLSGFARHWQ